MNNPKNSNSIFSSIKQFSRNFWLVIIVQMLQMMAYQVVLLQMSIYISQKDATNGLQLSHTSKGVIFFFWALSQRLTPILSGTFADSYGYKKTMLYSVFIIFIGYILLGTQTEYLPFLISATVLGFGCGVFQPAMQAAFSLETNEKNTSVAWSIYFMMLNMSVFIAVPISKYLKDISWDYVFAGSALIILLAYIALVFYKDSYSYQTVESENYRKSLISTFRSIVSPKILYLILIMTGFAIVYMQFYETLPNFIFDWLNSSDIVSSLNLPDFMLMQTGSGKMLSYEWIYNINTVLTIVSIVYVSSFFTRMRRLHTLLVGIALCILGLLVSGSFIDGKIFILGVIIYTFGEMLTNPTFNEHISHIAPKGKKGTYLSFLNISYALGLASGSLLGGYLYNNFGDKANLAAKYLKLHYGMDVQANYAINTMLSIDKIDVNQLNLRLWSEFQPFLLWLPFALIAFASIVGLWFYANKYKD